MPTRLNAILLIPVIVALVFGGYRVQSSVETWQQAEDAERIAQLVRAAATYGHAVINERDVSAAPLLAGDRDSTKVQAAYNATDQAAAEFDESVAGMPENEGLSRRLAAVRAGEKFLQPTRDKAYTAQLSGVQTEENYVSVQHPLMDLSNELSLGTTNITSYGRTLYAISLAKAAESLTRSIGVHILTQKDAGEKERAVQYTAFTSYAYLQGIALAEYKGGGTEADIKRLVDAQAAAEERGVELQNVAEQQAKAAGQPYVAPPPLTDMITAIGSRTSADRLEAQGITAESWFAASTLAFDAYRSVEQDLADQATTEANSIASKARTDAIVNSIIVVLALTAAFIVAGLMARSMGRSMRKLRHAAFEIAEKRLPALVDQLSRTDPGRVETRIAPIPITSHDEIGEVARAFDQVHREAVRLAAEQAGLRGNVNAIFTNLSRRNQGLVQRQLTLITELENTQADPEQLESLFKLDHLATRMRRNGENLLVLAGEEPGRRWNQPVPLVDVLRAAASEVEAYERVELVGIPETEIHGTAVTDLVHLLSELLENATTFSSPQTKVRVTATRLPDGRVMVEIHDKGIGLTAEDFADINHKLAEPPTVDVEIAKRMGLFVVGRLSERHGIRVQLRPSGEQAGTTSLVMLPEPITHGGGGEELPEDDFTVSRIVPEHEGAGAGFSGFEPNAAALGFQESPYGQQDSVQALDPVGRSLQRDGRRAQLEAAAVDQQEERPLFRDELGSTEAPPYTGQQPYPEQGYQEQPYAEPQQYTDPVYSGGAAYPEPTYGEQRYTEAENAQRHWEQDQTQQWTDPVPYPPETGSAVGGAFETPAHTGFDRPGPNTSDSHSLTDAGLPRRGDDQWRQPEPPAPAQNGAPVQPFDDSSEWHTANDENWQRAEQAREPKAGGVTSSGLPKRVPKANLVPGTAQQTPQGGPQVSRAPEDVRGRLSNLRRGVQQGRAAGTETNGPGLGPDNQEH